MEAKKIAKIAARPKPAHFVGDWVYNPSKGAEHNVRIVAVVWEDSMHGYRGGWRYWVPGLGELYPMKANPNKPYVEYEQVRRNSWVPGAEVPAPVEA